MISALTTLQQWLLFTMAILAMGCVSWRYWVLQRAWAPRAWTEIDGAERLERRVASLGVVAAAGLTVAWSLRGVVQVMGFRDPFAPLWDDVSLLLFQTFWGTVWIGQGVVLLLLLVMSCFVTFRLRGHEARVTPGFPWGATLALVLAVAITLAMSGHAMGVDRGRVLAVGADALHVLAAGAWMGCLAVLLIVNRDTSPAVFSAQIRAFSPLALASGAVLVLMGVGLSWTHLDSVSDLWTLRYGRLLSAKVVGAGLILALGFWNWRRGLPESDTVEGSAAVRRRAAAEVMLALGVLISTAMLVHATKP